MGETSSSRSRLESFKVCALLPGDGDAPRNDGPWENWEDLSRDVQLLGGSAFGELGMISIKMICCH